MDFRREIVHLLAQNTSLEEGMISKVLTIPPDPKLGDYAFPCFVLGNPKEEAGKLKEKIELPKFLSRMEIVGPYLNFFLSSSVLAEETLLSIYKQAKHYGQTKSTKKIVIEFCGPNTNKPLHLGHLRNIALGDAMFRILKFQGNEVIPVNIVNDRGIHISKSMLAYMKWGENKEPDKKGDHFVGDYYVLFSQHAKEDPSLDNQAQELLVKWEKGVQETRALWEKMNHWVLDGFQQTYERLGISFTKEYLESQYYMDGKELALDGLHQGVFVKSDDGALLVELEKYGLPNKVVLRSDGTSIYFTQDLYLATLREKDFKFDQMIYVVASEQNLHFQQLFKTLELLGKPFAPHLYHLSYGLVHLPSGRMKSREGTVIDTDDILNEVAELAKIEIKQRHQDLTEAQITQRADVIALGAIKFFMVRTDPVKDMVFDPKESVSFEGETGPYIQYTHARACSLLQKADEVVKHVNFSLLATEEEKKLLVALTHFSEAVQKAASSYKPHHLAQYLIGLSQAFNEFYHACPVLKAEKNTLKARLLLVDASRQVLASGLALLGIKAPEEM
jgi:arginyl-tRNA synthetase